MLVWRICSSRWASTAFSGEGGLYSPGRWHHIGNKVVYASQSLPLAYVEAWMHVNPRNVIGNFISVSADIPDDLQVEEFDKDRFPIDWIKQEPPFPQRDYGTEWLLLLRSVLLRVPTVTFSEQFNYLINPAHPDFSKIKLGEAEPIEFDSRMWKGQ